MDWMIILWKRAEVVPEDLEDFRVIVGMLDMFYGKVRRGLMRQA